MRTGYGSCFFSFVLFIIIVIWFVFSRHFLEIFSNFSVQYNFSFSDFPYCSTNFWTVKGKKRFLSIVLDVCPDEVDYSQSIYENEFFIPEFNRMSLAWT